MTPKKTIYPNGVAPSASPTLEEAGGRLGVLAFWRETLDPAELFTKFATQKERNTVSDQSISWLRLARHLAGAVVRGRASLGAAEPVFCVGRNKTGTTSLAKALAGFGYQVAPQWPAERMLRQWDARDFRRLLWFCRFYDAFQDVPFSLPGTHAVLDAAFPRAKFILTVRDSPAQWFASVTRFATKRINKGRLPTVEDLKGDTYCYPGWSWDGQTLVYGVTGQADLYDPDLYQQNYLRHNQAVIDQFRGRPGKLLVLNVAAPGAYADLADFLGFPAPAGADFPWENATGT